MKKTDSGLTPERKAELLDLLEERFEKQTKRHKGIEWAKVLAKLDAAPAKLRSLDEMEKTGGEPDVIGFDKKTGEYLFADCSPETPKGRRSICYDRAGLESRKEHRPANSAVDMASEMGVELLTEDEYHALQKFGPFDQKTSSWLKTPAEIRELDGAIFGDYRYGRVFIYHSGAQSYYAVRGFRGLLRV